MARKPKRNHGAYRPLSRGGHFESQGNKKLCFCPSSLALDERLDGQNLLFQQCVIKVYCYRLRTVQRLERQGRARSLLYKPWLSDKPRWLSEIRELLVLWYSMLMRRTTGGSFSCSLKFILLRKTRMKTRIS